MGILFIYLGDLYLTQLIKSCSLNIKIDQQEEIQKLPHETWVSPPPPSLLRHTNLNHTGIKNIWNK